MNRRKKMLTAALAAVTAMTFGSAAAQAAPTESQPAFCSANQLDSGECLTAVVSEHSNMSPEEAAVRQAIARGELPKAQKFVAARSTGTRDTKQRVLEGLVDGASKGKQDVMVPTSGVGRIVGKTHYMNDEPTYLYCGTTSCTQVGKVGVEYRTVLGFYPTVTLDGEWWVKQGPRVDFTAAECVTRHDARALPDTTVHTWSNCPKAHNASTWTTRALVLAENWGGGGTKGEDYFMRYRLSFKTEAGSKPTFGPFEWETHRYKVSSSGGSADWHT